MKENRKRVLSLLLMLVMLVSLLPLSAFADSEQSVSIECNVPTAEIKVYAEEHPETEIQPHGDGLYRLLPGEYFYTAAEEINGYDPVGPVSFTVTDSGNNSVTVTMTKSSDEEIADDSGDNENNGSYADQPGGFGSCGTDGGQDTAVTGGIFSAHYGRHQAFSVWSIPAYPTGTQANPDRFTVSDLASPFGMTLGDEDYFYFVAKGSVSDVTYSERWNAAAEELKPYAVDLHVVKHSEDGEENTLVGRGVIGAFSAEGFLFETGGETAWFSNIKGYPCSAPFCSASVTYTPVEGGRLVCDVNLLTGCEVENMAQASAVHTHDWKLTAEGGTATYRCVSEGCPFGTDKEYTFSLSVPAGGAKAEVQKYYDGEEWPAVLEQDVVYYVGSGDTVYTRSTTPPTADGTYTAELAVGYRLNTAILTVDYAIGAQKELVFTGEAGGVKVTVKAPAGAFPAGTEMVVSPVEDPELVEAVKAAGEDEKSVTAVKTVLVVDITFFHKGVEVEPAAPVEVTMSSDVITEAEKINVLHIEDNGDMHAVREPALEEDRVTFAADAFSKYAIKVAEPEADANTKAAGPDEYAPGTIIIPITKSWDDNDDAQGLRPESITVKLYRYRQDGTPAPVDAGRPHREIVLNEGNSWGGQFILPNDGEVGSAESEYYEKWTLYQYKVVEDPISDYMETEHKDPEVVAHATLGYWDRHEPNNDLEMDITTVGTTKNFIAIKVTHGEGYYIWTPEVLSLNEQHMLQEFVATHPGYHAATWEKSTFITGYGKHNEIGFTVTEDHIKFDRHSNWAFWAAGEYSRSTPEANAASIKNTLIPEEKGNLTVSKTVVSEQDADKTIEFQFTVTLSDKTITGEYGDMSFTNGKATFVLKHNESKTAQSLPAGLSYTVEETAVTGFSTTKTGDTGSISTTESKAEFTNTRETGKLTVGKAVTSDLSADKSKEFQFTVTLSDRTITEEYGDMSFNNGEAKFALKHNESKTAQDLPAGVTYTVTEAQEADFTTSATGDTGTISASGSEAEFTNTRKTGRLTVSKTVVSEMDADKNLEFPFTVTLNDETVTGQFGDMTFTNGEAKFSLKDGESKSASGLPVGIEFTVTEDNALGLKPTPETMTVTDTVVTAGYRAEFTNTRETGSLIISKIVVSPDTADKEKEFEFTVTLGDETITESFSNIRFNKGEAVLTLKDGESATIAGLPVGLTYTVTETTERDFSTTATGDTGKISSTKPSEAVITNTRITTEATVKKVWDDANNQDGKRPASLTVQLSNGTSVTLNDANQWTATVKDRPKFVDGTEVDYTWTETDLPSGYTLTDTSVSGTVTTLTNSYTPETTEINVTKVWDDSNNKAKVRPASVKIRLLADGKNTGKSLTLNEDNAWKGSFTDLPVYAKGKKIIYTVDERAVSRYNKTIKADGSGSFTITNKYTPSTAPGTGDSTTWWPWLTALILSGATLLTDTLIRRKKANRGARRGS